MVLLKRLTCVMAVLLLTACSFNDFGTALLAMDSHNAFDAASKYATNAKLKGDLDGAIDAWRKVLPKYENTDQPLTTAWIYRNIGDLLVQAKRVGEIPEIVEKYRAEMDRIESIGLESFDDMGLGYRAVDFGAVNSPEENRQLQLSVYQGLIGTDSRLMKEYYAQVGDSEKEAEYAARQSEAFAQRRAQLLGTEEAATPEPPVTPSPLREGTPEEPVSTIVSGYEDYQYKASYDRLMEGGASPDQLEGQIRQAILYTNQNDPRAVAAWDAIHERAYRIDNEGTWDGLEARLNLENVRDIIWNESLRAYRSLGATEQSVEFVKEYIVKRERSRATITSESDKRSFQEVGLSIYDSFIMMTAALPEENLDGMERAKSRAMLDLMSGGIDRIDNADMREIKRLQLVEATPGESSERGIALQGKLQDLRREHPEYYTLVSSEISDRDDLASTLDPDTIALSYYFTDERLFINVFGSEERKVFTGSSGGTEKVVSVPLPTTQLALAVQQFRAGLVTPVQEQGAAGGRVYAEYPLRDDGEEIAVVNESSLEIKVLEIWGDWVDLLAPEAGGANMHTMHVVPLVDTIAPGERAVVMRFLHNVPEDGWPVSEKRVDHSTTYGIKTNLGELTITNRVFAEPGEHVSVKVEDRQDLVINDTPVSLYNLLIKPVEDLIKGKKLVIVPHGILHSIPFEALQDESGRYLVEDHVITYAPSLNVLKLAREKERSEPTRLVAYSDTLSDLRFARAEVDVIRGEFGQSLVMTGDEVTRETVGRTMAEGDVIHFACHGVFDRKNPLHSGLVMASPHAAGIRDVSRLEVFNVMDIMGMKVKPSLVFLSACDSGRAVISGGDEIIGLTRGFFVAGSPSVINTLWSIDDKSTGQLVERFYENMIEKGMNKAVALQDAKLHIMRNGFEAPYYWAPFVLQGDWN